MIDFIKSFIFASEGLSTALVFERNFRILWLVALVVILSNYVISFGALYKIIFLLLIFLVLACELINSALENTCDNQGLARNDLIKKAKDFAAAAVFLGALFSLVILLVIIQEEFAQIYFDIISNNFSFLFILFIALCNFPLCLAKKLSRSATILALLAILAHAIIIIAYSGNLLFLVLGIIWHLLLQISHIKLYLCHQ